MIKTSIAATLVVATIVFVVGYSVNRLAKQENCKDLSLTVGTALLSPIRSEDAKCQSLANEEAKIACLDALNQRSEEAIKAFDEMLKKEGCK